MIHLEMKQLHLSDFINRALRTSRIGIPITVSILSGVLVFVAVLYLRSTSDYHLIRAFTPHISTLLETQDRPELIRLLSSIAREREVDLILVNQGTVYVSTTSNNEMDTIFRKPEAVLTIDSGFLSKSRLISRSSIQRPNGPQMNAEIYLFTPLWPVILNSLLISVIVLIFGLVASQIYANHLSSIIRKAIRPIEDLDIAVRNLIDDKAKMTFTSLPIIELDRIRKTILETKRALTDATDRLAEAKAKDLLADSYRRLIHDLYTPVAALKEVLKLVHSPLEPGEIEREKIETRVIRLAEQVLNQVSNAQDTLLVDHHVLRLGDLRPCVEEAVDQALLAYPDKARITVKKNIPNSEVIGPHDAENLRRAVVNLVSNALRACASQIEVDLEKTDSNIAIE